MAAPTLSRCGMRTTPLLRFSARLKEWKCAGMVPTSCETSTRCWAAANAKTSASDRPRSPAICAVRKFSEGSLRRAPITMALLRSASARNRTFTSCAWCAVLPSRALVSHADWPEEGRRNAFLQPTCRLGEVYRRRCRPDWQDRTQRRHRLLRDVEARSFGRWSRAIRREGKHGRWSPARLGFRRCSSRRRSFRCIPWPRLF
jgi:hypothetical protein